MENQKFIEMLIRLGFNRTEARVYLALLGGNSYKASEIAIRSGVPRQKVYDALKNLSHKGFCTYKPGKIQNSINVVWFCTCKADYITRINYYL